MDFAFYLENDAGPGKNRTVTGTISTRRVKMSETSGTKGLWSRKGNSKANHQTGYKAGVVPFYGARKSKNEVYFQMASLFREVTRGQDHLSSQWMDRILASSRANNPGNLFTDNI